MTAEQALAELMDLSSQVEAAVVLRGDGSVLASSAEGSAVDALGRSALDLIAAAFDLRSGQEVTRVEVELEDGGVFVLRDGGRTIAARTAAGATPGLVVYDLRTCLQHIEDAKPKRQRKPKEPTEDPE